MAGYSGTPLAKKLGLKAGSILTLVGAPTDYTSLIEPIPPGLTIGSRVSDTSDIVHIFTTQRAQLQGYLEHCRRTLKSDAMVWVSWPKKSAKVPTEISEDIIREIALPLGFVDVKVCAVSEIWSGLKLVLRRKFR